MGPAEDGRTGRAETAKRREELLPRAHAVTQPGSCGARERPVLSRWNLAPRTKPLWRAAFRVVSWALAGAPISPPEAAPRPAPVSQAGRGPAGPVSEVEQGLAD